MNTAAKLALLVFVLWLLGILCALLWPLRLFSGLKAGKEPLRAADELLNATVFNGLGRESLSSHTWRERNKWWAKPVLAITEWAQPLHCMEANKHEQPVVNFINGGGYAG